jgi:hypothetical protein
MESFLHQGWRKEDQDLGMVDRPRRVIDRKLQTQIWAQLGDDLDGESPGDLFGFAVSLSSDGTVLAVGARDNEAGGVERGHVRVFKFADNAWTQRGPDIDGTADNDHFGHSVSLSSDGNVVAIGDQTNPIMLARFGFMFTILA